MSNENSNSKNSPENKKRSWHKEPWYKRLFDKILVSCFLPCKHEWEKRLSFWKMAKWRHIRWIDLKLSQRGRDNEDH